MPKEATPILDMGRMTRIEYKGFMRSTMNAIRRFYDDPENARKFEAWQKARRERMEATT